MLSRAAALTPLALLTAWSIAQAPAGAEPVSRKGAHFAIALHPAKCSPDLANRLADEALAAAERAWPAIEKVLGVRACKPAKIHLWCDVPAFRAVEWEKCKPRVLLEAFAEPGGLEGHVLLSPQLSSRVLARLGLPSTTAQDVILVAARMVATQQLTADQTDPWVVDVIGLGTLEAVTNPGHQFGIDVRYDMRRFWIDGKRDRSPAPELRKVVGFVDTPTRDAWDSRQGHLALVAQHLAADDAAWARKLLARMRARKPAVHVEEARVAAVEAVLGADWPRTQQKFAKLCSGLRPVWEEAAPLMMQRDRRWVLVGEADRNASIYGFEPPPSGDYVLAATIEMEAEAPEPEVRAQLDWTGTDLVGVLMEPSLAWLAIYRSETNKWEKVVESKARITAGQRFDLRIEVTKARLRVLIDGTEILAWDCSARGMHGKWSVAAGDTITWIEGIRCEPLAPAKK